RDRRRQRVGAEMKIAQQHTCRQQRDYGVSQREHRPLINPQRDEERVDCERDYQRQCQDHDRPRAVLHALEPRRERVEHKQVRQQLWLDDRGGLSYCGEEPRARQAMSKIKSRNKPDAGALPARGWSGRFGEPMSERMQRFNASVDFDRRLASADIAGSLAHARMLAATGVLSAADLAAI